MQDLRSYYFWFSQPAESFGRFDWLMGYGFLGLLVLAVVFYLATLGVSSPLYKKLLKRFGNLSVTTSICGLLWFGFRYENTPIFALRYWAALAYLIGLVWLVFILKYLLLNFRSEKSEFEREQVKRKYIPGSK